MPAVVTAGFLLFCPSRIRLDALQLASFQLDSMCDSASGWQVPTHHAGLNA